MLPELLRDNVTPSLKTPPAVNMADILYNDVSFILDTYHDSDSQKDINPIYRISNRPESDIWYSEGYRLGIEPIIDKSKTYNKIFKKNEKNIFSHSLFKT